MFKEGEAYSLLAAITTLVVCLAPHAKVYTRIDPALELVAGSGACVTGDAFFGDLAPFITPGQEVGRVGRSLVGGGHRVALCQKRQNGQEEGGVQLHFQGEECGGAGSLCLMVLAEKGRSSSFPWGSLGDD